MPPLLPWLSRRSLRLLHAAGAVLGWLTYLASRSYRSRFNANASLAGLSARQRRAAVAESGKFTMELPRIWLRPRDQPIDIPVVWDGAELVSQALDRARGLILLAPHMGSFEMVGQAYAERFGARQPMTALYRPARQAWLRKLQESSRTRPGLGIAPASLAGVRQLMRALRTGQTLGVLPDQVPPEGMGVWVPFFGRPAYTMTLVARLAQQTGATLLLIWAERLPRGGGYRVCVRPPAEPLPDAAGVDDPAWTVAAAAAINRNMEAAIAHKPEQYLWGYHRYKQPRQPESAA